MTWTWTHRDRIGERQAVVALRWRANLRSHGGPSGSNRKTIRKRIIRSLQSLSHTEQRTQSTLWYKVDLGHKKIRNKNFIWNNIVIINIHRMIAQLYDAGHCSSHLGIFRRNCFHFHFLVRGMIQVKLDHNPKTVYLLIYLFGSSITPYSRIFLITRWWPASRTETKPAWVYINSKRSHWWETPGSLGCSNWTTEQRRPLKTISKPIAL